MHIIKRNVESTQQQILLPRDSGNEIGERRCEAHAQRFLADSFVRGSETEVQMTWAWLTWDRIACW